MSLIIPLHQIKEENREGFGGKAFSLAIPFQVTVDGYLGIITLAAESHGLWPWMNASFWPGCRLTGASVKCHWLCPWGYTSG
jgi:hypothetical protein